MKGSSILLALSGSEQSRFATEVCWELAAQTGSVITALHVVDTHSAWEFLGHENPGFLAKEEYRNTYYALVNSLLTLGHDLARVYSAEGKSAGIDDACLIEEGDPAEVICRRALDHDLVVMGHRPEQAHKEGTARHLLRASVAEALANECSRPLLVVQERVKGWSRLTATISMDHINEAFINTCLDFAAKLDIEPALCCLSTGIREEKPSHFIRDIRKANPRLQTVPIAVATIHNTAVIGDVAAWEHPDSESVWDVLTDSLLVLPTRNAGGARITVVDSLPSMFIRELEMPAILLWPEEFTSSHFISDPQQVKVQSAL